MQTFSNFSADAQTYIAAQTLSRIKRNVIVYGLGKRKAPEPFLKTFQFTRYEKLNLPKLALTEEQLRARTRLSRSRLFRQSWISGAIS